MDKPIICAMATFPARKAGMLQVVETLLPQCDKFYIYLNEYDQKPEDLIDDKKISYVLAGPNQEYTNILSHGKLYWLGEEDCYYLTVDDDIIYPTDYVKNIIDGINKYNKQAIVGYHGSIFKIRNNFSLPYNIHYKNIRILLAYYEQCRNDTAVHVLGTGVMGCCPKSINLSAENLDTPIIAGSDAAIALWAQKTSTPLIRLSSQKNWLNSNNEIWKINPLHRQASFINCSDIELKKWKQWKLPLNLHIGR